MRSLQPLRLYSFLTPARRSSTGATREKEILPGRHVSSTTSISTVGSSSGCIALRHCIDISHSDGEKLMNTGSAAVNGSSSATTPQGTWRYYYYYYNYYYGVGAPEFRGRANFSWDTISRRSIRLTRVKGIFTIWNISTWHRISGSLIIRHKGENIVFCNNSECSWIDNSTDRICQRRKPGQFPKLGLLGSRIESWNNNWGGGRHVTSSCRHSCRSSRSGRSNCGSYSSTSSDHDSEERDLRFSKVAAEDISSDEIPERNNPQKRLSCKEDDKEALVPLGKLCAEKHLCSRREGEYFAALGLIRVNGKPLVSGGNASYNARSSKFGSSSSSSSTNTANGSTGNKRKFPLFFVKRNADVQLMPRAQRVMDNRLTVLLHKPLHYLSCHTERKGGDCVDKPFCRQLLIAERRWEVKGNDGGSCCFPAAGNISGTTRGSREKPRLLSPGAFNKMCCAGRLDSDSSGLIVFTQDGRVASLLVGGGDVAVGKEYLVEVDLPISAAALELLRSGGLTLDGRDLLPARVRLLPPYSPSALRGAPDPYFDAHCCGSALPHLPHGTPATVLRRAQDIAEVVEHLQDPEKASCVRAEQGGGDVEAAEDADEDVDRDSDSVFVGFEAGPGKDKQLKSEQRATCVEDDAIWEGKTTRMAIELFEGRHRQIRRMCELVGLHVLRLHRIRIGKIQLGSLPEGRWRLLLPNERFV